MFKETWLSESNKDISEMGVFDDRFYKRSSGNRNLCYLIMNMLHRLLAFELSMLL
jgi:hypothetical protein